MEEILKGLDVFNFLFIVFIFGGSWWRLKRLEEIVSRIEGKIFNGMSDRIVKIEEYIEECKRSRRCE